MSPKTNNEQNFERNMNKTLRKNSKNIQENNIQHKTHEEFEETPTWAAVITVLGYAILSALGWLRDFLRHTGLERKKTAHDPNPKVRFSFFLMNKYCFILLTYESSIGFCSTLSKL